MDSEPSHSFVFFCREDRCTPAADWVYDPTDLPLDGLEDVILPELALVRPGRHSQRVAAQAGWHTLHSVDKEGRIQPLNKLEAHKDRLFKVSIKRESVKIIRSELREMGIDQATVYGDLTSVCRGIQDELQIPASMRLESQRLIEQQDKTETYMLANAIINGLSPRVGDRFYCMPPPGESGWSVGYDGPIDEEWLARAKELAKFRQKVRPG